MDFIIANVEHIDFKIERDLNEQFGSLPLPFTGMDSKYSASSFAFFGCKSGFIKFKLVNVLLGLIGSMYPVNLWLYSIIELFTIDHKQTLVFHAKFGKYFHLNRLTNYLCSEYSSNIN